MATGAKYASETECHGRHERSNKAATAAADRAEENMRRLDKRGVVLGEHTKDIADHEERLRSLEKNKRRDFASGALGAGGGIGIGAAIVQLLRWIG